MSFKCIHRFAIKIVVERSVITACIYKGVRNKHDDDDDVAQINTISEVRMLSVMCLSD